jgi:hypothetical protein
MLLRPEYLSQKLDRPLPTKHGGTLRTIGEACAYMTNMGKKREVLNHWQRVAKLILAKEDVLTVSRALELAAPPRSFQRLCPNRLSRVSAAG